MYPFKTDSILHKYWRLYWKYSDLFPTTFYITWDTAEIYLTPLFVYLIDSVWISHYNYLELSSINNYKLCEKFQKLNETELITCKMYIFDSLIRGLTNIWNIYNMDDPMTIYIDDSSWEEIAEFEKNYTNLNWIQVDQNEVSLPLYIYEKLVELIIDKFKIYWVRNIDGFWEYYEEPLISNVNNWDLYNIEIDYPEKIKIQLTKNEYAFCLKSYLIMLNHRYNKSIDPSYFYDYYYRNKIDLFFWQDEKKNEIDYYKKMIINRPIITEFNDLSDDLKNAYLKNMEEFEVLKRLNSLVSDLDTTGAFWLDLEKIYDPEWPLEKNIESIEAMLKKYKIKRKVEIIAEENGKLVTLYTSKN